MFFNSDNVIVYPASNRLNNSRAIYTSETNLTNPLRVGNSFESYLITYKEPSNNSDKDGLLEFILGGYYFKINFNKDYLNSLPLGIIYLGLLVGEDGEESELKNETFLNLLNFTDETVGLDLNNEFSGLYIGSSSGFSNSDDIRDLVENYPRFCKLVTDNASFKKYYYWLKIGEVIEDGSSSKRFIDDPNAYIRYDQDHLGYRDENNIIKKVKLTQITTKSLSEFAETGYPENPKKGDILLVYIDD